MDGSYIPFGGGKGRQSGGAGAPVRLETRLPVIPRLRGPSLPGRATDCEKGFSLLEALIVVSIGLIMLGFSIPLVQSAVRNYTLNSAATNVVRMVQLARYAAINKGGNACTVFASSQFGLDADCDGAFANDVRMVVPSGISLSSSGPDTTSMSFPTTPAAVSCSDYAITFNSRGGKIFACGTATGTAVTNIIFITGWGNTRAVTVTGTGRARSWSWNGTTWR